MNAKHTPGPWVSEVALGSHDEFCGIEIMQSRAADDFTYRGGVARVSEAEHINGITRAECEANARLIAAAPELLDALQALRDPGRMEDSQWWIEACRRADAAIAKATGGAA